MTIRHPLRLVLIIILLSLVNGYDPLVEESLDIITGQIVDIQNIPMASISIQSRGIVIDEDHHIALDSTTIFSSTVSDDSGYFAFDGFLVEKWHMANFGCWGTTKSTWIETNPRTFALLFTNSENQTFCIAIEDTTGTGEYSRLPIDSSTVDRFWMADESVFGKPLSERNLGKIIIAF